MIDQTRSIERPESDISEPSIYRIKEYQTNSLLDRLSYMLIRPPRFLYNEKMLRLPPAYQSRYKVKEFQIPFKLTLYQPNQMLYVVLYLHGNSSSRFEGYMQLKQLPDYVGLACFDFNGCGMRFQSQYITLGYNQSKDVDVAAKFLKGLGYKTIGWGRSMGSVSLLLSSQLDIMVADSPFYSIKTLCKQSSSKFLPDQCCCLVHCFFPCVFCCIRGNIQDKAGFDLNSLEIASALANNPLSQNKSLFIMAGRQDGMIKYNHSQIIYEAFPGKKEIQLFEGTHNSSRPEEVIKKAFNFIEKQLRIQRIESPRKIPNIRLKPINRVDVNKQHITTSNTNIKKQYELSSPSTKKYRKQTINSENYQKNQLSQEVDSLNDLKMDQLQNKKMIKKNSEVLLEESTYKDSEKKEVNSQIKDKKFICVQSIDGVVEYNDQTPQRFLPK